MLGCVLLLARQDRLRKELAEARANDALLQATIVALAPTPDGARDAKATVAWDPTRQTGVIRINNLPAAGAGKDYQLWAVDAGYKDPLNAGIVHVDANGTAQVEFKPTTAARHVKAFALSLEREGGVPEARRPYCIDRYDLIWTAHCVVVRTRKNLIPDQIPRRRKSRPAT